jgi:hypothetical protein
MKNHIKRAQNEQYAKRMSQLRSSTVEPVLGTLINFMGMKKVNTRGMAQAEKHVLMASLCYNLKKLLKYKPKKEQVHVNYGMLTGKFVQSSFFSFLDFLRLIFIRFKQPNFGM